MGRLFRTVPLGHDPGPMDQQVLNFGALLIPYSLADSSEIVDAIDSGAGESRLAVQALTCDADDNQLSHALVLVAPAEKDLGESMMASLKSECLWGNIPNASIGKFCFSRIIYSP